MEKEDRGGQRVRERNRSGESARARGEQNLKIEKEKLVNSTSTNSKRKIYHIWNMYWMRLQGKMWLHEKRVFCFFLFFSLLYNKLHRMLFTRIILPHPNLCALNIDTDIFYPTKFCWGLLSFCICCYFRYTHFFCKHLCALQFSNVAVNIDSIIIYLHHDIPFEF